MMLPGLYCPMGCAVPGTSGTIGVVGVGARLRCMAEDCPRPTAVEELLSEKETEHIVTLHDGGGFTIRHPLRERLDGVLENCPLHAHLADRGATIPGKGPGKYRVRPPDGDQPGWRWEMLDCETCGSQNPAICRASGASRRHGHPTWMTNAGVDHGGLVLAEAKLCCTDSFHDGLRTIRALEE